MALANHPPMANSGLRDWMIWIYSSYPVTCDKLALANFVQIKAAAMTGAKPYEMFKVDETFGLLSCLSFNLPGYRCVLLNVTEGTFGQDSPFH